MENAKLVINLIVIKLNDLSNNQLLIIDFNQSSCYLNNINDIIYMKSLNSRKIQNNQSPAFQTYNKWYPFQ